MLKNLYITSTEASSGKSLVSLAIMELLLRKVGRVGFFRPIINDKIGDPDGQDKDILLILKYFGLDSTYEEMYAYTLSEAKELISLGKNDLLLEGILNKVKALEGRYDFLLYEGTDFEGVTSAFEFDINAYIANNLACPVLIVTNGKDKNIEELKTLTQMAVETFEEKGCSLLGVIINRARGDLLEKIKEQAKPEFAEREGLFYAIPENDILGKPTIREIADALHGKVLHGEDHLDKQAYNHVITAMHIEHAFRFIKNGSLLIVPFDRTDVIFASLLSLMSNSMPNIAGIVLTGGQGPDPIVRTLIEGLSSCAVPIISVETDTYTTVMRLNAVRARIAPDDQRKITIALNAFESHVDAARIGEKIVKSVSSKVSPKMFEYGLIQKAKSDKRHIVLPEGMEPRILRAAEILLRREVVDLTLLGEPDAIRQRINELGLHLEGANIVKPLESKHYEEYVRTYFELRKHKGITQEYAQDIMADVTYFATMMVHLGHADGMVSGSINTTQHTIRPAFEFVKTKPGCSIVSSVFFMCMPDRVLVYGDCAVNPNPTAEQLAEIAVSAAETARIFGIDPKVAMLSYSTGASGKGEDVEIVRRATRLAKEKAPHLKLEGPIQYDAAVDSEIARTKMPESEVAGQATVFIFPDLNTGNSTYKAVQRSSGAVAVGPVLQGLNKPVNDLSRGCTVTDIVNTVAITAIQAQAGR